MSPKNGYVPADMLVEVEPSIELARDTAAAYLRAKSAAASASVALSIARPAGGYRSFAVQQDMHVHPGLYNLDPTSTAGLAAPGASGHGLGNRVDINGNGRPWFLAHCAQFGFDREFGTADPGHYRFKSETWPTSGGGASSTPAVTGWHVGETDFKGAYGENNLNGAKWYCIEPATSATKTIWGVATQYGLTLAQVSAWTAKVAASKWAGQLLQSGSSWWDGSGTYYAGVCIALNDVAGALDAYEAQQIAAQQAAIIDAAPAPSPAPIAPSQPAKAKASPKAAALTPAQLDAYVEALKGDVEPLTASIPADTLSGLFAGHDAGRKRAYLAYAGAALLVSFGPDVITVGLLTATEVPAFAKIVSLATSVLLKVGTAFGFIAASNASKQ